MRNKTDKIIDNTYHEIEFDHSNISFKIESTFEYEEDPENKIHFTLLHDEIEKIIKNSEFNHLSSLDENGDAIKLNKVQINKIYNLILENVNSGYRKMEIFSIMSDYFDINPAKFYTSLSNKFKDELSKELDKDTDYRKKNKIKKIF